MTDYGHDLVFGTFITPQNKRPQDAVELARTTDVESEISRGNRIIDEAAKIAGRNPHEIRRIFDFHGSFSQDGNGFVQRSPEQWVEKLFPLAIEHGVSVFILVGDDPRSIKRWGGEVAPALRKAVAEERGSS